MVIVAALVVTVAFFGSQIWGLYKHQQAIVEAKVAQYRAMRDYEDRFQQWMTRIYQNLRLEHYLAAYGNARKMPLPRPDDRERVDELVAALQRISAGLLEGNLLKEAEEILMMIKEFSPKSDAAHADLIEVESRRKFDSAKFHLKEAEFHIEAKNFRGALVELQKADIELNAVVLRDMSPVMLEKDRRAKLFRIARFQVLLLEADSAVRDARVKFSVQDFDKVQKFMSIAARKVGIAAFYDRESEDVRRIRDDLHNLAADLAYEIPNQMPLWNKWSKEHVGRSEDFFFLSDYHFDVSRASEGIVRIGLDYLRHRDQREYVVRYRIFFDDGSDYFNGHFLGPVNSQALDSDMSSIVYEQLLPERLKNRKVRRIELSVYNEDSILLSRVMRAFRETS